jgi:hypothetical protein
LNIGDLPVSVHASIRASRTRDRDYMIEEFAKRSFKLALNRGQLGLDLPSVKFRTVVGECELEIPHRFRL